MNKQKPTNIGKGEKEKVWHYALRINGDQIRQFHMSSRALSEGEVKAIPDYAWVDEYFMDKHWSFNSWFKQYEKQKSNPPTPTITCDRYKTK